MSSRIPQRRVALALLAVAAQSLAANAQATTTPGAPVATSISARTTGMDRRDGFLPIYLDGRQGRILLEVPRDSMRALLLITQATGLGSNPIGIDRGSERRRPTSPGSTATAIACSSCSRIGTTEASSGDPDHARSRCRGVSAEHCSVAAAAGGGERTASRRRDRVRDARLERRRRDAGAKPTRHVLRRPGPVERSIAPYTKAFPENSEIDVALTFATTGRAGRTVDRSCRMGAPSHCGSICRFVKLPDGALRPRVLDPRVGYLRDRRSRITRSRFRIR